MTRVRCELQKYAQDSLFRIPDASEVREYLPETVILRNFGKSVRHVGPRLVRGDAAAGMFSEGKPLDHPFKVKACIAHWRDGRTWDETGIIAWSIRRAEKKGDGFDGLCTAAEFRKRYSDLDTLYDQVARGKTQIHSNIHNDPVVHIGPDGRILFGGGAYHRMTIAFLLGASLPVALGLVHETGMFRLPQLMGLT